MFFIKIEECITSISMDQVALIAGNKRKKKKKPGHMFRNSLNVIFYSELLLFIFPDILVIDCGSQCLNFT